MCHKFCIFALVYLNFAEMKILLDVKENKVDFILELLNNFSFVKAKTVTPTKPDIDEVLLMAEESLAEEWLSEDDNRWDKVL